MTSWVTPAHSSNRFWSACCGRMTPVALAGQHSTHLTLEVLRQTVRPLVVRRRDS